MSITGTIIDSDKVNGKTILAITETAIYRCADITAASPYWKRVYYGPSFPSDLGTSLKFRRVRCSGGRCYALAYVKSPSTAGAAHGYLFVSDGGLTWQYRRISNIEITDAYDQFKIDTYINSYEVTTDTKYKFLAPRVENGETYNPWAIGAQRINSSGTVNFAYDEDDGSYDDYYYASVTSGVFPSGDQSDIRPRISVNGLLNASDDAAMVAYIDAIYGSSGWVRTTRNFANESNRVYICPRVYRLGTLPPPPPGPWDGVIAFYIFWKEDDPLMPLAMDVGKNNNAVVYVGLDDQILVTRDGGQTWDTYNDEVGAYDIECHKAQTGDYDITFWANTGALYRATNGSKGSAMWNENNPAKTPFRVASDPIAGWPIYALSAFSANTFTLKKTENGGAWQDLVSNIYDGRSLRYAIGSSTSTRRLYYLDASGIHYGTDGLTFTDKIGDWSGYGNPRVIYPLDGNA